MAGTVVILHHEPAPCVGLIVATCTADTDGSFPTTPLPEPIEGRILSVTTDPGSPAPQDDYDVTLVGTDGFDRLGGAGANRDTSTTERAAVTAGYVSRREGLSLAIAGNNVNGAKATVTIHYTREV